MSKEPNFSKIKGHVWHGQPTGKPELDQAVKAGGGIPGGLRDDLVAFHDPQTGEIFTLPADQVTAESVAKKLAESLAARKETARQKLTGRRPNVEVR